jgi:hypothetical protein
MADSGRGAVLPPGSKRRGGPGARGGAGGPRQEHRRGGGAGRGVEALAAPAEVTAAGTPGRRRRVSHNENGIGSFLACFLTSLRHASEIFAKGRLPYLAGGWVVH